jgi:DNA polymerase III subunit delta'
MTKLIGHDDNLRAFSSALTAGKLHHGWILAGPRGLGKAGFAKNAATMIIDPMGKYTNLIARGTHPDLIILTRLPKEPPKEGEEIDANAELKRNISVHQIRDLQARMATRPGLSDKRAIILDAADDLDRNAANALLKSLEEPPIGTYFLLVSHASDRLLPTIRSRCQMLRFEPLNDLQMDEALLNALPELDNTARAALIRAGAGAPGQAMDFIGLELEKLEADMAAIIQTGDRDNAIRSALSGKLSLKAAQPRYEAFLRRVPQVIAEHARSQNAREVAKTIDAWEAASALASRAVALSLDKPAIVLQMGALLASVYAQTQKSHQSI